MTCYSALSRAMKTLVKLPSYISTDIQKPSPLMFSRIEKKLVEHGAFIRPRPKTYNKGNRDRDEDNVLACVEATPSQSCRVLEQEVDVPKTRVQRILTTYKFRPYKIKIEHLLHPGDAERRLLFCNWYLEQIRIDNNFARFIIWSDEVYFSSAGILNRHNSRYWSQENHHVIFEREQQGRFGFSVACFILGQQIQYRIYEGNLSGDRYLEILEDVIHVLLENVSFFNAKIH